MEGTPCPDAPLRFVFDCDAARLIAVRQGAPYGRQLMAPRYWMSTRCSHVGWALAHRCGMMEGTPCPDAPLRFVFDCDAARLIAVRQGAPYGR
jgi:hypothetical protein